ncbi:MAG: response regulator [Candidatus Poribacteria bacterium]|nr:response regulator [Candidatus Poribacteria bacterium]MDE0503603.1 response regulator [Candidatus Poribacteria bacterium]
MAGQAHRILIVDDDNASLEVLSEVLTRANYEIYSASTGYDAAKIIQENTLDMAILDYDLPDTTGLDLLQHIKRTRPRILVIIMSANTSTNVKFDVFEAGAFTFIPKPIDLRRFLQYVRRALGFREQSTASSRRRTNTVQIKKSTFFRWTRIVK